MAGLFIDGADHYSTAQIGRKYTTVSGTTPTVLTSSGRRGGGCIECSVAARWFEYSLPSSVSTIIVGVAINRNGSSAAGYILYFGDSGSDQCGVYLEADGRLSFARGTTVLATTTVSLPSSGWSYLEAKVTFHNSTGAYELRLNGNSTPVLSGSGVDTCATANNSANTVRFHARPASGSAGPNASTLYDDVYILDTTGSANNDFLGDVRVDALLPNANGNSSQLTGSDGNSTDNYLLVDESPADDDTTYVESSTSGHKDTYDFPALGYTAASIFLAQINAQAKKDDAGARSIALVTRSGGTDYDGTPAPEAALSTSYRNYRHIREVDPATSAAWTQSNLEAAQFGVKVAS